MRKLITYFIFFIINKAFQAQTKDSIAWSDLEDTCRIKVVKLDLNSNEEDFSPVICNNKLIFTSARTTSFGIVYKEQGKEHNTNIYYAAKKDSINFSTPKLWPGNINTHYNEGCATLNRAENLLIYTGNEPTEKNKLRLYTSDKISGKWQDPKEIWFCKDNYSYCHPALNADGKTLFFASDRPGSIGGMDIYFSIFINDEWSEPKNIGTKVNTTYNEIFPMISENNTLYFSSNRPEGIGGLDIYSLNMDDTLNNEAIPLESSINSVFDDFGIFSDSLGESGYFSSSRSQSGKDEIYYFKRMSPDFKRAKQPDIKTKFCYTFFEETTVEEFDTSGLEYEWNLGDSTTVRGPEVKHCYTKPGTYSIQLNIVEKSTGTLFYNQVSYDHIVPEPEQLKIECVDELICNQKLRFSAANSSVPGYTIQKIYWDFGDSTYSYGKNVKHLFKTQGTYTVTLGVIAKNNSTGQLEKFRTEKSVAINDNF